MDEVPRPRERRESGGEVAVHLAFGRFEAERRTTTRVSLAGALPPELAMEVQARAEVASLDSPATVAADSADCSESAEDSSDADDSSDTPTERARVRSYSIV